MPKSAGFVTAVTFRRQGSGYGLNQRDTRQTRGQDNVGKCFFTLHLHQHHDGIGRPLHFLLGASEFIGDK